MTLPIRSVARRWRVGAFHPLTRYGYNLVVYGGKRGDNLRIGTGLALMAAGWALKRRGRPLVRIYGADLDVGESMTVRVVQDGDVISETVVEAE